MDQVSGLDFQTLIWRKQLAAVLYKPVSSDDARLECLSFWRAFDVGNQRFLGALQMV